MRAEPDVAPGGDRAARREDRDLDLEAGRARRRSPARSAGRAGPRRARPARCRSRAGRWARAGRCSRAAGPRARISSGRLRLSVTKTPWRRSCSGPPGPRRELAAEVVTLEEVGGESGAGEPHQAAAVAGRESRRVGRRVLEPRQRDERRAEARAGGRLAQERHRDVRHRARRPSSPAGRPRRSGRGARRGRCGAIRGRSSSSVARPWRPQIVLPGLPQVVAEAPRVPRREERHAPVIHRAHLLPHRRRQRAERLEVEARAVVGEVGGEDEEGAAVVELREPLRRTRARGPRRCRPTRTGTRQNRPSAAWRNGSSISTACSPSATPGTTRASVPCSAASAPSHSGTSPSACGRPSRRRGRSRGRSPGARDRRRRPARSPRASSEAEGGRGGHPRVAPPRVRHDEGEGRRGQGRGPRREAHQEVGARHEVRAALRVPGPGERGRAGARRDARARGRR